MGAASILLYAVYLGLLTVLMFAADRFYTERGQSVVPNGYQQNRSNSRCVSQRGPIPREEPVPFGLR